MLLIVAGVALLAVFPFVERRAAEPILPLELFHNRIFVVTSAIGFIVGLALFGAITYLPLYLQVVKGHSPTSSGLTLVPLMAGLLVTSILSGQLISRYGRYKPFPIIGTAIMLVGVFLLSRLTVETPMWKTIVAMVILGLGLGLVMQVLVLAAQNSVDHRLLGVATSGATMFRGIGGSIGVAAFGAIFANRLRSELAAKFPAGVHIPAQANPEVVKHLPAAIHTPYIEAFAAALQPVFLTATGDHLHRLRPHLAPPRTTTPNHDHNPMRPVPNRRVGFEKFVSGLWRVGGRSSTSSSCSSRRMTRAGQPI